MSRVSVAEGSKPKPKESFRFLRRDEGRLSYSAAGTAESPARNVGNGSEGDKNISRERRDSKSLREAIAFDMRNAKSHDPLGEVVVAVPRKAPPPSRAASVPPQQPSSNNASSNRTAGARRESPAAAQQQKHRPQLSAAMSKKRPEWVDPEVPPPRAASAALPEYDLPCNNNNTEGASDTAAAYGRYGGLTPRRAASGATVPRYADANYDEVSSAPSTNADRNFFRRPQSAQAPSVVPSRGREEEDLMLNLEQEIRAAQEEREHYASAKQQLDREKQRFEAYRLNAQQRIEEERTNADGNRVRDQRDAQQDLRSMEDRHRNVSALLVTEREANRRLSQENDSLRAQLEDLTATLRETQKVHKSEVARMRRDIDSLTRRNAELLAMAKELQLTSLEESSNNTNLKSTAPALRKTTTTGSRNVSAARDRNSAPPVPALDTDELAADERRTSTSIEARNHNSAPPVMDFTPRANASEEAAREKRNRRMQERVKAEQAEMEERKRQRAADLMERKRAEEENRQKAAAAEVAERRRRDEEDAAAQKEEEERRRHREQQEKEKREREASTTATTTATKPVEERKSSGHPLNTPRMQSGTTAAAKKRLSATEPHPPVPPKPPRIVVPTREELLGDKEPAPAEDFPNDTVVSQTALGDNPNKKETLYRSGKREIHYANGTVKAVLPSGHTILHFTNGDVKCTFPSGKSTYWYDAAQTMHTQMPDGVQTFEFRTTGQAERHMPDGGKSILYPDGIYKIVHEDGNDETFYPDGEPMEE